MDDSDSAKKEDQVVMYESENPLCGKESPDLNPLYPEDSIENNSSYVDFEARHSANVSPAKSEKSASPSKSCNELEDDVDVAQSNNKENSNDKSIAQDTVVNASSADECCDSDAETKETNVVEETAEAQIPIMSISAQVMERDNSEGYVTSFETDDAKRRNDVESKAEEVETVGNEEEVEVKPESTAVQCNGCDAEEAQSMTNDGSCKEKSDSIEPEESVDDIVPAKVPSDSLSEVPLLVVPESEKSDDSTPEIVNCDEESDNAHSEAVESESESRNSPGKNDCG
jgi:hypothetical protein